MPALTNAKHERFAQEIAKGSSQRDAYIAAGYAATNEAAVDASASRLLSDVKVSSRVAELLERAAKRTEITVASITEKLIAIAEKAEVSPDAPLLSVARAAYMDAAKLNGLVIDKSLTAQTSLEDMLDGLGPTEGAAPGEPAATTH